VADQAQHVVREGAHRAAEPHAVRDHVVGLARVEARGREHRPVRGGDVARDHALQRLDDGRAGDHRIERGLGARAVAALALHLDVPEHHARHRRPGADAVLPDGEARAVVQAEHGVAGEPLEQPIGQHGVGAAVALLGGLEDEVDRALEAARLGEVLRGGEQHRGVPVMAAGMHPAGAAGGMGEAVLLLHGQGVHVGAQPDARRVVAPEIARPQHADDARAAHAPMHLDPPGFKPLGDQRRGAVLLQPELGMGVDVAADRRELGQVAPQRVEDRAHPPLSRRAAASSIASRSTSASPMWLARISTSRASSRREPASSSPRWASISRA
jgi:hypothetical protein